MRVVIALFLASVRIAWEAPGMVPGMYQAPVIQPVPTIIMSAWYLSLFGGCHMFSLVSRRALQQRGKGSPRWIPALFTYQLHDVEPVT